MDQVVVLEVQVVTAEMAASAVQLVLVVSVAHKEQLLLVVQEEFFMQVVLQGTTLLQDLSSTRGHLVMSLPLVEMVALLVSPVSPVQVALVGLSLVVLVVQQLPVELAVLAVQVLLEGLSDQV
jgi:hypothetical protein